MSKNKKMLITVSSLRDNIQFGSKPNTTSNDFAPKQFLNQWNLPTFDHIDNLFNEVETIPDPVHIRTGDRYIRTNKDSRVIGNAHTNQPALSLEMDFIEESPLCITSHSDSTSGSNHIAQIWNCLKEVDAMRQKKKSKYVKIIQE